jgi:hypothetical protein
MPTLLRTAGSRLNPQAQRSIGLIAPMPHGHLEWNLDQLQAAMHLNVEDVRAYFTDGRPVSFMLERRITREVLGGRLATSEGDDHDLVDAQGRKWEVRSVSAGGI